MKLTSLLIMIFSSLSNALFGEALQLGSAAPQISTTDHTGQLVDLGQELSTGTVLVFFYPKAMTPGCTKQACSLRDGWDQLQARQLKIFGVSSDTAASQYDFRDKYQLPFTLLADTEQKVAKAFGKSRWSRQAYIFRDGVLVWQDLRAATSRQAEEVLAALDKLPQ